MMMRRRLFGLELEQYWFDPEGYRASRAHVAALRTTEPLPPRTPFAFRLPERTLWIELERGEEEILKAVHKRARDYIRSGEGRYSVSRATAPEERAVFHAHYARFARERSLPLPDPEEERDLVIYLARDADGEPVHGCAFLAFPREGVFRYRYGVRIRDSHAHPGLFWRALRDCRAEGFRRFDLGGVSGGNSGDPHMAGIDRFKSQFGGRPVEGWLYVRSPFPPLDWALRACGPLLRQERRLRRLLASLAPRVRRRGDSAEAGP